MSFHAAPREHYNVKQYIYRPQDAGLVKWPEGELQLDGIEITQNPSEADVFVCPGNIRIFCSNMDSGDLKTHKLNRLPYFAGNEARHVFFDCSDYFTKPIHLPIMFIRCDVRTWMLPSDVNTLPTPWPVEDYSECIDPPTEGFQADVSFHGWLSTDARRQASASVIANPEIRCDTACFAQFHGRKENPQHEKDRQRAAFRASMKRCRMALCPESIPGVLPYRFFEAMSAGRVPLLVSSDYVLPFKDEIDYASFTVFCERDNAASADKLVVGFCGPHTDPEIIEKGKLARAAWEKWLDTRNWAKLHAYAVQKHLKAVMV